MKILLRFWVLCIWMTFFACGDNEYNLHRLDICRQTYHSCKSVLRNVYCSCDRMCIYYDNCCFDAATITGGWKDMSDDDQRRQYLKITTCEIIAFRFNDYLSQGAFMISSCPASWDSDMDTRKACELYTETDVRDILPVVDTSTNLSFKNRQCAKCHRVKNYIPWLLEIKCSEERLPPFRSITEGVMTKLHSDHCSYRFIPPNDVTVHYCYQEFDYSIISNISELDNNSTCRNRVFSPVGIEQGEYIHYFRTLQCLIVNEGPLYQELLDDTTCDFLSKNLFMVVATLSNLIDFSDFFRKRVAKCKEEEIQLSDEDGCHCLYCPARSEPSGGECVDIEITSDGFILDLLFEVNTDFKSVLTVQQSLKPILDTLVRDFGYRRGSLLMYNYVDLKHFHAIRGSLLNSEEQCSVIQIHINVKGIALTGDALESERPWVAKYFNNFTKMNSDGSVIRHIANIQNMSCMTNISFRNPSYLLDMISVDNDLPCPAVKLHCTGNESDRGDVIKNVSHSYFHFKGTPVSPLDVVYANEDCFLCIDTLTSKYQKNSPEYDTTDIYRSYINTACASISIICMIYCLIQYCIIPIFRDGKSDLLIVLIFFLLLSQTCFFLLSHFEIPSKVCEWVGIFHHFTWLVAFVFMFLCPYRFNAEIRDLQTYSRSERMMVTVKYILVGLSLPLVVIICIKTTNSILAPTEEWYGGRLCFISQNFVVLFGFVVPVFMILCGNAFLFISIIRFITSTSIAVNSNKSNMMIFIKISTIMGFSWIIGIIAIMSQSEELLLVFEVLSNLQGAFITFSFSCTSRVRAFYKNCFK